MLLILKGLLQVGKQSGGSRKLSRKKRKKM